MALLLILDKALLLWQVLVHHLRYCVALLHLDKVPRFVCLLVPLLLCYSGALLTVNILNLCIIFIVALLVLGSGAVSVMKFDDVQHLVS